MILETVILLIIFSLLIKRFQPSPLLPYNQHTHVLITGASMGLGKEIIIQLAKTIKCTFSILDIQSKKFEQLKRQVNILQSQIQCYECDITNKQMTQKTIHMIMEKKVPDILINNAGIVNLKYFNYEQLENHFKVFDVNLIASIRIISLLLPAMKTRNSGHIVNISSAANFLNGIKTTSYLASKSALSSFHDSLRLQLKSQQSNIKTTIIKPWVINTGMFMGFKSRISFFFPMLKVKDIGKRIVKAIMKGEEQVYYPWICRFMMLVKILPCAIQDFCYWILMGNNHIEIKGRKNG